MAKKAQQDPLEAAKKLMDEIRLQQAKLSETVAQAEALWEELQRQGVMGPVRKKPSRKPN